jgi:hypothetical protein
MIEATQSVDEAGHIVYRGKGVSRPNLTMLAEALGVPEDQLALTVDPVLWEREQKRARRRPRGPVKTSEQAFLDTFHGRRD